MKNFTIICADEIKQEDNSRVSIKREREELVSVPSHNSATRPPPEKKLKSVR